MNNKNQSVFNLAVIVASLGYFVDMYDLLLFTIVKRPSLLAVGSTDGTILPDSILVMNWQMIGLLLGGIIWGVIGDKKGRLNILFGSIILYSIANFCHGLHSYRRPVCNISIFSGDWVGWRIGCRCYSGQ